MTRVFNSPRLLIGLLSGALALGCLFAEKPRYPELDDPFGPRHGPPPRHADLPERQPAPPPAAAEEQVNASELMSELDNSSADYDEPAADHATMKQLHALERFLNTPPEQLAAIRQTIERVEAMSDEEKQAMLAKIENFRQLQKDKIDKLREIHRRWEGYPRQERHLVHRYMMSLTREQAMNVRREIARLQDEEFDAYFQNLLAQARSAEEAGELPSLAETVRHWSRDRGAPPGSRDRKESEQVNARKDNKQR